MKLVAIIFARGGSKGIKNKNILKFKKTTLLGNSIEQAMKTKNIDKIFVSSDNKKILREAKKYKTVETILRPKYLAKDNTAEIYAWRHAILYINNYFKISPKFIVSIPTTCPLRRISDIEKCINKAIKKKLDYVFTVIKSTRNPFFNMILKKEKKIKVLGDFLKQNQSKIYRRQDAPNCYDLTTACYVFNPSYVLQNMDLLKGKVDFVEIPRERGIDIDEPFDYKMVELMVKK